MIEEVGSVEPLSGDLRIRLKAYVPDKRRRDLDNIFKALFDSLEHAKLFSDDEQICVIIAEKCEKVKGGRVDLIVEELL